MANALALATALAALVACGGSRADARHPAREPGCAVKALAGEPTMVVDDLGVVTVDCVAGGTPCERQVLDAVCIRGGDVAWGLGYNALTSVRIVAHAAHTKRATQGPGQRGCAVQAFTDAPPMPTENIGPVTALCAEDDTRDACLRELKDQVCLLGGDVLWQVGSLVHEGEKQRMHGRAAHTK